MSDLQEKINECILDELKNAATKHPSKFVSLHDGTGVIREELEEVEEALLVIQGLFKALWANTRKDQVDLKTVAKMTGMARSAAEECIQLAAMCQKYTASFTKFGGNTE